MANTLEEHALQADETDNRWEVMAMLYCEKLTKLLSTLDFDEELDAELTVKHYFNGAAVYANGTICASWSPVGLAFKLPADEADELKAILAHNRDEEKEHAAMVLEWIRRRDPAFDHELKDFLFTDKPIAHD